MNEIELTNYKRYDAMAYRLNHDAYLQQIKGRSKPLTVFNPCRKALCFTAAMGMPNIPVAMVVLQDAERTACTCHPDMHSSDLFNLYGDVIREVDTSRDIIPTAAGGV